ncbi:hypothetical protein D5086_030468 [Populus alba]|uniref:Uncharacterized protein n=1 Tax=Populus alba TaxID=43335 RepID=A0ACC4API3_POPAL
MKIVEAEKFASMESSNGNVFQLIVKQGKPTLVHPVEETEKGLYFLSNFDQNIAVIVRTIYCFKSYEKGNGNAGELIKNALKKVLVHYYPLAGRLTISSEGKLIVNCTGKGAVFVEAEANCAMEEIGDITKPDPKTLWKLVYDIPVQRTYWICLLWWLRASSIRASGITREGSHPVPISWQRKKKHKCASGFASFGHEDLPRTDADLEINSRSCLLELVLATFLVIADGFGFVIQTEELGHSVIGHVK